ncbi:MAG: hypothetical protein ABI690_13625 [Chloroflexota bacterium]
MAQISLPAWARVMYKPLEMVAGADLRPNDTIYFSARAYPRILWKKLSDTSWSVLEWHGDYHKPGRISIEPGIYYVVKRALAPAAVAAPPTTEPETHVEDPFREHPLANIRVEGEYLAAGDIVYLDVHRRRAEILEIGAVESSLFRGEMRSARLHYLDLKKVEAYTFSGFRVAPPFTVIAGPKFEATRRDPSLVFWREGVNRWCWKG